MSDSFSNPLLLNPNSTTTDKVPVLQGFTQPFPVVLQDVQAYYVCTMPNHHMCRTDGKRLAFVFGVLSTRDKFDIEYMEKEIANNNPFIRRATDQEVNVYNMRIDPKGTMERKLTPEIEARVRQELEIQLRNELEARLNNVGITLTEDQKVKLSETVHDETVNTPAGVDALQRLKDRFSGSIKVPGATVTVMQNTATGGNQVLGGISGTDATPNSAESVSK